MREPLPRALQEVRGKFWVFLTILVLFSAFTASIVLLLLQCKQPDPNGQTLLGGPGGFTFLAIVIALSAYLRGVASSAEQKREDILTKTPNFYATSPELAD